MGTITACKRIWSTKLVTGIFCKFDNIKASRIVNTYCASCSFYTCNFKQNSPVNLCRKHSWKVQNCYWILMHSAFSTDMPGSKIKLRHDPNKFGNLVNDDGPEMFHDEGDIVEDNYITYPIPSQQQLRIKQYADIIKQHLKKKEIKEAIDVLETRMIKQDRVKPDAYIYSLVIGACGRFGLVDKAFKLYNKMKERQLTIPKAVYTALFNACAHCDDPQDGLARTKKLQRQLVENGVELNAAHFHSMMKAYGRCGDLARAFQVADLMNDKGMNMDETTFNFLLQACISDTEVGFRHALWVWHKMLQRKVKPSVFTFNLLLRCVRDCNLGEIEDVQKSLTQLTIDFGGPVEAPMTIDTRQLAIEDGMNTSQEHQVQSFSKTSSPRTPWDVLPDLLSPTPRLVCDVSSLDLTKPHERLLLLGGSHGLFRHMAKYGVLPTVKTYTILLDCLPPTSTAEKMLVAKMRKDGVPIDIDFCNMLIKKRSFRFDYPAAQNVLELIKEEKLIPDIVTFGVLALACSNEYEAKQLVRNMREAGYRMNVEILGAMLKQGCLLHNFKYVTKVLYLTQEENVEPSPLFMENIKCLIASSREILKKQASGEEVPESLQGRPFRKEFTTFMYKYNAWLEEIKSNKSFNFSHKQRQK